VPRTRRTSQAASRWEKIQVRDGKGPVLETDRVFHVPDMVARLVRKDAAFAGLIPQQGPTSKRVDFHCLRKSCARILIELGVHPKHIQQVLRHSDIRLTMDLYGELGEDDLFRELPGKFPVPKLFQAAWNTAAPIVAASI
jgi:integrase